MEVNRNNQLQYLERKYKDLMDQYLYELTDGNSLNTIRDISFVLTTIKQEIKVLEKETGHTSPPTDNGGNNS